MYKIAFKFHIHENVPARDKWNHLPGGGLAVYITATKTQAGPISESGFL